MQPRDHTSALGPTYTQRANNGNLTLYKNKRWIECLNVQISAKTVIIDIESFVELTTTERDLKN